MNDDNITGWDIAQDWFWWIALGSTIYMVILLVSAILVARKAGYSHWLGVIAVLVPVVGPVLFLVFASLRWPALQERDRAVEMLQKKGVSLDALDAEPKAELDFGGKMRKMKPKNVEKNVEKS